MGLWLHLGVFIYLRLNVLRPPHLTHSP